MSDTRWEEAKEDIIKEDIFLGANPTLERVLNILKDKGWKLSYPDNWPDLCSNCKNHIDKENNE